MAVLKIKDKEVELKFSIMLDKVLNKNVKDEQIDKAQSREKLSGGIQKVLPELIDEDVEILAEVFLAQTQLLADFKNAKLTIDDVLEAINTRMEDDGDATKIFTEVFEAIDDSAFSRKQFEKFVENMSLLKELRSEELDEAKTKVMLDRLNTGYKRITGKELLVQNETKA